MNSQNLFPFSNSEAHIDETLWELGEVSVSTFLFEL